MEEYNQKIRPWIGIVALVAIGIFMIIDPNLMDHTEISGRKQFIKLIFSYIWGIPAGILLLGAGIYLGYKKITASGEEVDINNKE